MSNKREMVDAVIVGLGWAAGSIKTAICMGWNLVRH